MRNGPSPLAVPVIRHLLRQSAIVPEIVGATGLPLRTVRSQVERLRVAGAVRVKAYRKSRTGQAGPWAIYSLDVVRI